MRTWYRIGFIAAACHMNMPFIPVPIFESLWDMYDWQAGYGAAVKIAHQPKDWLV